MVLQLIHPRQGLKNAALVLSMLLVVVPTVKNCSSVRLILCVSEMSAITNAEERKPVYG